MDTTRCATGRPKVAFFLNAQAHMIPHAVPIAAALARLGEHEVHVVAPVQPHLDTARDLVGRLGGAPVHYTLVGSNRLRRLGAVLGSSVPPKLLTLLAARRALANFDAIVVPERTSILLRRLGLASTMFIHTSHGAGDRAAGYDRRIRRFDYTLLAGEKDLERMTATDLLTEGGYAIVGYPKFEAADATRNASWRPFEDDKPILLYNPHFSRTLSSWKTFGRALMQQVAADGRYNLIVAPHVRLFDSHRARKRATGLLAEFGGHPNVHIDLGSPRSVDMTYTAMADAYIGDVSSQIYEFLRTPKPCLFLNGHADRWHDDPHYAHWRLGPVTTSSETLIAAIDAAFASHPGYRDRQRLQVQRTFAQHPSPAAVAAGVIGQFIENRRSAAAMLAVGQPLPRPSAGALWEPSAAG